MQLYPFIYILSTGTFELQGRSRVAATKTLALEAENIYYLAVCGESLLNPGIDDCLVQYLFISIPEKVHG